MDGTMLDMGATETPKNSGQEDIQETIGTKTLMLLQELMKIAKKGVEMGRLHNAIFSLQDTLYKELYAGLDRGRIVHHLVMALLTRYALHGWVEDLDACYTYLEGCQGSKVDTLFATQERDESIVEIQAAIQHIQACRESLDVNTLEDVILVATVAISSGTIKRLTKGDLLLVLGKALVMKYLCRGGITMLDRAVRAFLEAECIFTGHTALGYAALTSLAHVEWLRVMDYAGLEIKLMGLIRLQKCVEMAEVLDSEGRTLCNMGRAKLGDNNVDDGQLQEAVTILTSSLQHRVAPHSRRASSLSYLGVALSTRFQRKSTLKDLEKSIVLHREALGLRPAPHPERSSSLNNLAAVLSYRFEVNGIFEDLEECIVLHQEVLDLQPASASHPIRSLSLNNLACALFTRFRHRRSIEDLEQCITLHREALILRPPHHPDRSSSLENLANALSDRFKQKGRRQDLEECIMLHKEALKLLPTPHPERSTSLNNLATVLSIFFQHRGTFEDLEESIMLHREALTLQPAPHRDHTLSLGNLANALSLRFEHKGTFEDLQESIALYRQALDLRPAPHPDRPLTLNNLGNGHFHCYLQRTSYQDLEECILIYREALELMPKSRQNPVHSMVLSSLATALSMRFEHDSAVENLSEIILLHQEALDLRPVPHPDRCISLNNLAAAVYNAFEFMQSGASGGQDPAFLSLIGDLAHTLGFTPSANSSPDVISIDVALHFYEKASKYETGSLIDRLRAAKGWAVCARRYRPSLAPDVYRYAMTLLPLLASVDLTLWQRQDVLQHAGELVGDAVRSSIDMGQIEVAVTLLTAGRSIFWSQALQLRTPVNELEARHPKLAEKFITISTQLEHASHSTSYPNVGSLAQSWAVPDAYIGLYALEDQRRRIIKEIRLKPGFEKFLEAPSFPSLQPATNDGPIVLFNSSKLGCDALIVQGTEQVKHVPLHDVHFGDIEALKTLLHTVAGGGLRSIDTFQGTIDTVRALVGRDMVLNDSSSSDENIFRLVLAFLWTKIVRPVIEVLGFQKQSQEDLPRRIWWCPTGSFASLPIHAAGIYSENNEPVECLFEYAVSSYCTSVQDLLRPVPQITETFKMTAIIEPEAPGAHALPATCEELEKIKKHLPNHQQHLIVHLGSKDFASSIDGLLSDVRRSSITHFGCHGMQDLDNPLDSYLLLSGGRLTMSKIIKECQVPEGALAYLSACETAKGDEVRPNESLNLVATMLFAGFRSVVGTIWSIFDDDAPIVADAFYRHFFRNGGDVVPNVRDAAYGLHLASKELRERGKSFRSWVPYVHYGI